MSGASDKMIKGIVVIRHFKWQSSVLVFSGYEVCNVSSESLRFQQQVILSIFEVVILLQEVFHKHDWLTHVLTHVLDKIGICAIRSNKRQLITVTNRMIDL